MGSGGGSTTSTVTQSNLPKYAQPYYEAMMDRGMSESERPYQPYQDQRLAGMSDTTAQGLNMTTNFANSGLGPATSAPEISGLAALGGLGMQNYQSANITNSYNGPQQGDYQGSNITSQQIGFDGQPTNAGINQVTSNNFDQNAAQQYMSPYMQDVIDVSKQHALSDYGTQQAMNNANMAAAGAFGGSRQSVMNMIGQNQLMTNLSDLQATGMQNAYENAQQQFNADRSSSMQAQQANQGAGLTMAQANQQAALNAAQANEQSRQYGYGATESAYQKAADLGLNAQQLSEQFRQSGKELGLKGMDIANTAANSMVNQQQGLDAMNLSRIKAQLGAGQTQEDYSQQQLDQAYNDFVNQRDSERQNLQFFSSLLQGVPISPNRDITQTQGTNPLAGALGTASGLQALYGLGQQGT